MVWVSQLKSPKDAPKDGSYFMGIPKYKTKPVKMCWDSQMECFFSVDFACIDRLASWYELEKNDEKETVY